MRTLRDSTQNENYTECMSCGHYPKVSETGSSIESSLKNHVEENPSHVAVKQQHREPSYPQPQKPAAMLPSPGRLATLQKEQISDLITNLRWPGGPQCTNCKSNNVITVESRKPAPLRCQSCQHYFTAHQGAFFGTSLTAKAWLSIISSTAERRHVLDPKQIQSVTALKGDTPAEKAHLMLLDAVRRSGVKLRTESPDEIARKLLNQPPAPTKNSPNDPVETKLEMPT